MTPEQKQAAADALTDIAERAELECETLRKAGEKQGNYLTIAKLARSALRKLDS